MRAPLAWAQPGEVDAVVAAWSPPPGADTEPVRLSRSDFARGYVPVFLRSDGRDTPAFRRQVAREMIEHELIARRGFASGLDRQAGVQAAIQRDAARAARRRYLEREVLARLAPIAEAEVDEALRRQQRRLLVRQVFARTEAAIRALSDSLAAGTPMAELARRTMPDSAVAARGGVLGWLGWGDADVNAEDVLFALEPGTLSEPVASLTGWHIFRVDSVETTLRFGQPEPSERMEVAQRLLARRFDLAAARHTKALVEAHTLVTSRASLAEAWRYLAPALGQADPSEAVLRAPEVALRDAPPDALARPVAWLDGAPVTTEDLFRALPEVPRGYLQPNLKPALELAVRDRLVTAAALEAGYGGDQVVMEKARRAALTYTYSATLAAALDTLTAPDLRALFTAHPERFRSGVVTTARVAAFPTRAAALHAARQYAAGSAGFASQPRDLTAESALGKAAARRPLGTVYGPVEAPGDDGAAAFWLILPEARRDVLPPFESVVTDVTAFARSERLAQAHEALLPASYDPAHITYDDDALASAPLDRRIAF